MSYSYSNPFNNLQFFESAAGSSVLMINSTAKFLGKTFSKFDHINAQMKFCWELTGGDLREILKNGCASACRVKEIEYYSDALYRAQFSMAMTGSGTGVVEVKTTRELYPETTSVNASIHFIENGDCRMYGNVIPRSVFADVIGRNGTIVIIADLNPPPDDEQNNGLPDHV